ncbi:MAG TPA: tyrosine-type recombinase/integrase, partial [Sulfurovum sp.]
MAINKKDFIHKVATNIKANKTYNKFLLDFRNEEKRITRVIDYSDKDWTKKQRLEAITIELATLRRRSNNSIPDTITIDALADIYYRLNDSSWNRELKRVFELHISPTIGKKRVVDIKAVHIDTIRTKMKSKGHSKQTKNGCSDRTIKKALVQCLKPIMEYAYDNRVIEYVPKIAVKNTAQKKTITNPIEKLSRLFNAINELYKDDCFYRSLFLFALYGRRLNEILTLEWKDVNFENNTYTVQAHNSKNKQQYTYSLPHPIKGALMGLQVSRNGLIFISFVTGKKITTPKRQLERVKELSGVEELTFHLFRHILTSALASKGNVSNVMLSASLGHQDFTTVTKHYATLDHTSSSNEVNSIVG